MKSVNVTFQVDENIKNEADALFDDLGMSLSTALNVFLRQAVREQGFPFILSAKTPNAETIAAMEETDEMIRTGGGQHFQGTTEDFFAMLDAEE